MANAPDPDVQKVWQEQRGEEALRLADIRVKAQRLDDRTRRWRVVGAVCGVLLVLVEAWQIWRDDNILDRSGDALTIAAFVYIAYRLRTHLQKTAPRALGATTCIEFYRAQVAQQRDLAGDSWGYLLPFVPGVTLSLLAGVLEARPVSQVILFIAAGIMLFAGIAWWNAYTARRFQRELDAIDAQ